MVEKKSDLPNKTKCDLTHQIKPNKWKRQVDFMNPYSGCDDLTNCGRIVLVSKIIPLLITFT